MAWIAAPEGQITEHFYWWEAKCRCCGRVPNIQTVIKTARWLETVRTRVGKPIKVLSWCRCPKHNRAVGGAPDSCHPKGLATDVTVKGESPDAVRRRVFLPMQQEGLIGGVGIYPGFTHIDRRRHKATWEHE